MTNDPASPSQRAAVRAQRRARREARIARRESYFELFASGYSCQQIAEAAKVSAGDGQARDRSGDRRAAA